MLDEKNRCQLQVKTNEHCGSGTVIPPPICVLPAKAGHEVKRQRYPA
jgi:hypothetical protein